MLPTSLEYKEYAQTILNATRNCLVYIKWLYISISYK